MHVPVQRVPVRRGEQGQGPVLGGHEPRHHQRRGVLEGAGDAQQPRARPGQAELVHGHLQHRGRQARAAVEEEARRPRREELRLRVRGRLPEGPQAGRHQRVHVVGERRQLVQPVQEELRELQDQDGPRQVVPGEERRRAAPVAVVARLLGARRGLALRGPVRGPLPVRRGGRADPGRQGRILLAGVRLPQAVPARRARGHHGAAQVRARDARLEIAIALRAHLPGQLQVPGQGLVQDGAGRDRPVHVRLVKPAKHSHGYHVENTMCARAVLRAEQHLPAHQPCCFASWRTALYRYSVQ